MLPTDSSEARVLDRNLAVEAEEGVDVVRATGGRLPRCSAALRKVLAKMIARPVASAGTRKRSRDFARILSVLFVPLSLALTIQSFAAADSDSSKVRSRDRGDEISPRVRAAVDRARRARWQTVAREEPLHSLSRELIATQQNLAGLARASDRGDDQAALLEANAERIGTIWEELQTRADENPRRRRSLSRIEGPMKRLLEELDGVLAAPDPGVRSRRAAALLNALDRDRRRPRPEQPAIAAEPHEARAGVPSATISPERERELRDRARRKRQ